MLTCFNARDAGGVKHPLHLSGTHRNCPQCPQLRRRQGIKSSQSLPWLLKKVTRFKEAERFNIYPLAREKIEGRKCEE